MENKVLLIGCGKMGSALLDGFQGEEGLAITVVDPSDIAQDYAHIDYHHTVKDVPQGTVFDTVIVAVKPQVISETLPSYLAVMNAQTVVVSIVAGKDISFFETLFPGNPIIRTMPNLPVTVGEGAIVAVPNANVSSENQVATEKLFNASGCLFWEKEESVMDAVTALSGSGPAYFFYFIECLMKAGQELGLSAELSKALAYQTAFGSVTLAKQSDKEVSALREQVTSPGGTTAAALSVFQESQALEKLCRKAMQAAKARSIELQ